MIAGGAKRLRSGGLSGEVGRLFAIPAAEQSGTLEVGLVAEEQSYRGMVVEMNDVSCCRLPRGVKGVAGKIWVWGCIVLGNMSSLT